MNRLQYWLTAKTSYSIQSPFLFELYTEVIQTRLDDADRKKAGIAAGDRYAALLFKLANHYGATPCPNPPEPTRALRRTLLQQKEGSLIGVVEHPHRSKEAEQEWAALLADPAVTLSVDLYDAGLYFTSSKLSRQHFLLR